MVGYGFDLGGLYRGLPDIPCWTRSLTRVVRRRSLGRTVYVRRAEPVCEMSILFDAMNPFYKNLALWMVIGLIVILLFNLFQAKESPRDEIVFSDFLKKVERGRCGRSLCAATR